MNVEQTTLPKKYHDAVLSHGSPPVKHVRALMMDLPIPQ